MHHEIARLAEYSACVRRQQNERLRLIESEREKLEDERKRTERERIIMEDERKKLENERIREAVERIRIEEAADRICAAETAAAERERKNNIRKNLEQEAKMMGKMYGMATASKLHSLTGQTNQNKTNIQSVEASPVVPQLPSPEASSDEMTVLVKGLLTKNFVRKIFEGIKARLK